MPLRVTFHDLDEADQLVAALTTAGFDAGTAKELFAGEDDGEELVYVVHTDAPADDVEELIRDSDAWVEESSPLIDASGATPPPDLPDLPDQPRR